MIVEYIMVEEDFLKIYSTRWADKMLFLVLKLPAKWAHLFTLASIYIDHR